MTRTRTDRPVPLGLTALVALFSALCALAVSNGTAAHAHGDVAHRAAGAADAHVPAAVTRKELALRGEMRRLWEDHIVWTRLAIISLTTGSADTKATVARLLRNQTDIGNAVAPFYGRAAAAKVTRLLRGHILIAADLVSAAGASDRPKLAAAQARWERNADDIARALAGLDPRHWGQRTMRAELGTHLRLTTNEALARLRRDWAADVAAYDAIHRHALHLADLLSDGLVASFPARFR